MGTLQCGHISNMTSEQNNFAMRGTLERAMLGG